MPLVVSKTFAEFYLTLHAHNPPQRVNDFHQVCLSQPENRVRNDTRLLLCTDFTDWTEHHGSGNGGNAAQKV
jgi:hypothetical protein